MTDASLTSYDLYKELVVNELIEKTKNGGLIWSGLGGNQFSTTYTNDSIVWTYYISKTQIGSLSYRYNLDIKKQSDNYLTLIDGPLPHSSRDSGTKNLYEIVEILTLELDSKVKEAVQVINAIPSCQDTI